MTTDGIRGTDAPPHRFHHGAEQLSSALASQSAAPASGTDPSPIESLLHSLVTRLEENDRRYDAALSNLESRLNDISARTEVASTGPAADPLGRVAREAESLARQVQGVEPEQRAQNTHDTLQEIENRISGVAARMQQGGSTSTPAGFEQPLPAGRPATVGELDTRMDELARNLDTALDARPNDASLRAIESQLEHLSAQFTKAQQQYNRVEAIESNLARLMEWAQSQGSQIEAAAIKAAQETIRHSGSDAVGVSDRLEWVHQELKALDERSREMDERTVDTLQSMNSALQSLAGQAHRNGNAQTTSTTPEPHAIPAMDAQITPDGSSPPKFDTSRNAVGASIPDYHDLPPRPAHVNTLDGATSYRPGRAETAFDDDDFLASARRAAEAAATRPGAPVENNGPFSRFRRGGANRGPATPDGGRSRPVLVTATIILLVISAALLYGQLKQRSASPVAITPGTTAPVAPPAKPSRFDSRIPEAAVRKDTSKLPAEQPHDGRSVGKRAPLATERTVPQDVKRDTRTPAQPATERSLRVPAAPSQQTRTQPISAEPKLASLPQPPVDPRYPGVSVTTVEPDRAPPRKQTTAPLVPAGPAISVKPAPKALIIPQPETAPHPPAKTQVQPESKKLRSPMPPASIGPQSLRLAAASGNREAQFEVASRYAAGNGVKRELTRASQWYARAAAQGLAPAQYRLAALYERGQSLEKDLALARVWYERAAKQGNVKAMHNLAVMYTGNKGREPDYTNAAKWFAQAARYGLADSQFNLGVLYEAGLGIKKSPLQAYQWFSLASARGDSQAEKRKQGVRLQLRSDSLRTADRTVKLWRARPIDKTVNEVRPPRGGWRSVAGTGGTKADQSLVSRAQTLLNKLGYDAGVPDGVLGGQTISAIRRFESKSGKEVTGRVTPALISQLKALAG